jgi:nitrous oxidase accessory protein NosD
VRTAAILCIAAVAVLAPVSAARAQAEASDATRWSWRGAVAAGKTLEIKGINGSVRAEAGTGSQVEVTA